MAEQDDGGNVVEFHRRQPADVERLELLARAPSPTCRHMRKRVIDEKQRTVQCSECGAWLDPIWCLLTLVGYREQLEMERRAIEAEKRRLAERRAAAIERRQRADTRKAATVTKANCLACRGTGWRPGRVVDKHGRISSGVERCECRKSGARLIGGE